MDFVSDKEIYTILCLGNKESVRECVLACVCVRDTYERRSASCPFISAQSGGI